MSTARVIDVYTDGACRDRSGGWAALVLGPGGRRVLSGKADDTTSNRMELTAAINALESLPQKSEVALYSDSQYLVKTMTRGWRRNANLDLWQRLDTLNDEQSVRWEWVKGHAGVPGNEFVNAQAEYEAGTREQRPRLEHYLATDASEAVSRDKLTHLDEQGRASMVDVGGKDVTHREAVARGFVSMKPETLDRIQRGEVEKGDVFAVARLAGIMGAKQTPHLIPLCHPLPLDRVAIELEPDEGRGGVEITATAATAARTGVEMEALTAVTVAALALYDMCKSADRGMRIENVRLVSKRGGKSGDIVLE